MPGPEPTQTPTSSSAPSNTGGGAAKASQPGKSGKVGEPVEASDKRYAPGGEAEQAKRPDGLVMKSFGTWVQSGLSMVDARKPFLAAPPVVDGVIGPETRGAIRKFQQASSDLIPGVPKLPATGFMDGVTTWAMEQGTGSKNPVGKRASPPEPTKQDVKGGADGQEESVPGEGGADAKVAPDAAKTDGSADKTGAEGEVQKVIAQTIAAKKTKADAKAAYDELKVWTRDQYGNDANPTTVRAKGVLEGKYTALAAALAKKEQPAPAKAGWLAANFFEAYWSLACDQFAHQLMLRINGSRMPNLNAMRKTTSEAVDKEALDGTKAEVAGRDLRLRGKSLARVGEVLEEEDAEAGIGVHMKTRPDVDRPYDPNVKDEFHHWFTYIGEGKFADSFKPSQTGAKGDEFMTNWLHRDFHQRGRPAVGDYGAEPFNFTPLHTATYADAASLQEYEQLVAASKKGLVDAEALPANDAKAKRERANAVKKAKTGVVNAELKARQKKLPRPKPDLAPKVTALYRPAVAAEAKKAERAKKTEDAK